MAIKNLALLALALPAVLARPHEEHGHLHYDLHKRGHHAFPTAVGTGSSGIPFPAGNSTGAAGSGTGTGAGSGPYTITSTLNVVPQPVTTTDVVGGGASSGNGGSGASGSGGAGGSECGPPTVTVTSANTVTVTVTPPGGGNGGNGPSSLNGAPTSAPPFPAGNSTTPGATGSGTGIAVPAYSTPSSSSVYVAPSSSSVYVAPSSSSSPAPVASPSRAHFQPEAAEEKVAVHQGPPTWDTYPPEGNWHPHHEKPASSSLVVPVVNAPETNTPAVVQEAPYSAPQQPAYTPPVVQSSPVQQPAYTTPTAQSSPAAVSSAPPAQSSSSSPSSGGGGGGAKAKGLVYNNGAQANSMDVSWACNWGQTPGVSNPTFEFVPQLWGNKDGMCQSIASNAAPYSAVLFYNEPDMDIADGGSATSYQQAAQDWNTYMAPLQKSGKKVSTPCVSNAGSDYMSSFLSQFSKGTFDIMCFHWYGTSLSGLQQTVSTFSGLASQYGIPELWISEMADTSNPSDLSPYTNYLEGAVDRYAYNLNDLNGATL